MTTPEERRKYEEEQIRKDYENRDSGGSGKGILDFSIIGGYKKDLFWKPTTEDKYNSIDILPFLATEKNPDKVPVGMPSYKMVVWAHKYIGPENLSFVCLQKMFGKPCPICQDIEEMAKDPNMKKDELNKIAPKQRVFYNILDKTSNSGFQIFEESYYLFQKELMVAAGAGGRIVTFQSLENGKTVEFLAGKVQKDKFQFTEYRQFNFIDRQSYDDRIYSQVYPLDQMLVIPSYDEIKNAYYQIDVEQTINQPHATGVPNAASQNAPTNIMEPIGMPDQRPVPPVINTPNGQVNTNTGEIVGSCPSGYVFGEDCDNHRECATCQRDIYDKCDEAHKATRRQ